MKLTYSNWHKELVHDDAIQQELSSMTKGELEFNNRPFVKHVQIIVLTGMIMEVALQVATSSEKILVAGITAATSSKELQEIIVTATNPEETGKGGNRDGGRDNRSNNNNNNRNFKKRY
jgi:hypothetical protein